MFRLFSKKENPKAQSKFEFNHDALAIISLLVEAANIDQLFEKNEKDIICKIVKKQFNVEDESLIYEEIDKVSKSLLENGDLVTYTKKIKSSWSLDKRKEIIEMLWKVCLIDNILDPYEDMLIRKIAGLLYVEAKDSNAAKNKVLKSLKK